MPEYTSAPLIRVAEQFARLPGIGMKTAQRLAYHILALPTEAVEEFSAAMVEARSSVRCCDVCCNFTVGSVCPICADERRNAKIICVVESPRDVSVFERTGGFDGRYHVLHGLLSPMEGTGPDDIRVKELMKRLSGDAQEVIMATNPTIEGEATASYISRLVKTLGIKTTRLAYGLPVGATLEFADDVTLTRALENRNEI
ncbi:MAG: recombination mediator RecR [Oscillospiraceae bacterium]|jgi:recombination protein RecR|nr:recombination mediator RecR [Oscillospiraceae bacterium]